VGNGEVKIVPDIVRLNEVFLVCADHGESDRHESYLWFNQNHA